MKDSRNDTALCTGLGIEMCRDCYDSKENRKAGDHQWWKTPEECVTTVLKYAIRGKCISDDACDKAVQEVCKKLFGINL